MSAAAAAERPATREAFAAQLLGALGPARRIVAIAGPPASGKTTLAAQLAETVNRERPGAAAALGLDGYHFDDQVLEARGDRARKGAPHTFDVAGLSSLLERLRADAEEEIAAPVFDRSIEIARAGAMIIPRAVRLVILEGNYLLLDETPWDGLRALFDLTARIEVDEPTLRARLMARWDGHGFSEAEALARTEGNDLPNARRVMRGAAAADWVIVEG